jgi:hypothetical protein
MKKSWMIVYFGLIMLSLFPSSFHWTTVTPCLYAQILLSVVWIALVLTCASLPFARSFLGDATLSPHKRTFNLTLDLSIGMIFIGLAIYQLTHPIHQ